MGIRIWSIVKDDDFVGEEDKFTAFGVMFRFVSGEVALVGTTVEEVMFGRRAQQRPTDQLDDRQSIYIERSVNETANRLVYLPLKCLK